MKKLTVDELYKLFTRSSKIKMDGQWLDVYGSNEDEVYLTDDGDEWHYSYEEVARMVEEENVTIEFFELKKIEL